MRALDLEPVRRLAEGYLDDDVRLLRDTDRQTGGALDDNTGAIAPNADLAVLWTGRGSVLPAGDQARANPYDPAPTDLSSDEAAALLPMAAPRTRAGDVLEVTRSLRDPQLTGARFRVRGAGEPGTYAVLRRLTLDPI